MITLEQAKKLRPGDILIDNNEKRWKVTSCKLWQSPANAHRIKVGLKHGLYTYDSITEADFSDGVCGLLTREKN